MNTEKIPFSIDKMKDAIRYETRDGRGVTQVEPFDCGDRVTIATIISGKLQQLNCNGRYISDRENSRDLFIIVEKRIEYPCLCWVSDAINDPSKEESKGVTVMGSENYGAASHDHWNYSTPLTDDELKEFGLMRVENLEPKSE